MFEAFLFISAYVKSAFTSSTLKFLLKIQAKHLKVLIEEASEIQFSRKQLYDQKTLFNFLSQMQLQTLLIIIHRL